MKKVSMIKKILFLCLFSILFVQIFNKENLRFSYHKIKDLVTLKDMIFLDKEKYSNQLKKYDCLPELIKELPDDSTIIIGHAYGRVNLRRYSNSISPYIHNFIKKNKNKIKTIFFTGDVFNIPKSEKWQSLYDEYRKDIEIFIVPGNHDVGSDNSNSSRDIFNNEVAKYQSIDFPYFIKRSGFNIVLDDSTVRNSLFDFKSDSLMKVKRKGGRLLVLRHHILIKELQKNSGSTSFYYSKEILKNKFKTFDHVSFISGNGGMRKKNDRISCYEHDQFIHILNGIGDVKSDNILVLYNGNIYRYEINKV